MDTQDRWTCLHYAAYKNKLQSIKKLVELGADITITDQNKRTPLDIAVQYNKIDIIRYMIQKCNPDITKLKQENQQKIRGMDEIKKYLQEKEEIEKIALSLALRDGTAKCLGIKLLLVGAEFVGKSCVAATLVDDPFQECAATQGADIQICNTHNWKKISNDKFSQQLHNEFLSSLTNCAEEKTSTAEANVSANRIHSQAPSIEENIKLTTTNTDTELKSLPKIKSEDLEAVKAVKNKKIEVIKMKGGIDVTILDFAGQVQYHNTHSIFMRKDNVIMIVFNASQPLSKIVKVRPSSLQENNMTNSQNIHFWMKSVHSIYHEAGDGSHKSSLLPVIILVATHLDLLGDSAEKAKEQIIQTLAKELEGKPYAKHLAGHAEGLLNALRKYCIFLSNKVRDPKSIKQLQNIIIEVSAPILSTEHPLVFLNIERELLGIGKGVITIDEFHDVTQRCGFVAAIDSNEFAYALEHFHHRGTVLHFSSIKSLKGFVILSPHWLTKLLSYALIAHPYKPTGNGRDFSFNNLRYNGILLESFLSYMLDTFRDSFKDSGVAEYHIKQNEAVDLMKWFGFLAEIHPKTNILEEDIKIIKEEKKLYIVPSLLPDDTENKKKIPEKNNENVRIIYYYFPDQFLPPMLFNQVVAMCINRNEEKSKELIWLRKGKVKMVLDDSQYYCVSLCKEFSSIQLTFILHGKEHSAKHRMELFQYIQSKIELLMKDFMQASTKPKAYIPCYHKDCSKVHAKLELLCAGKVQHCPSEELPLPKEYYQDLFPKQGEPNQSAAIQLNSDDVDVHTAGMISSTTSTSCEDTIDCSTANVNIQKNYCELKFLPINIMLDKIYSKGIITFEEKQRIEANPVEIDRIVYIIDRIIIPSLKVNDDMKFRAFIEVMKKSGNSTLISMAAKLSKPKESS